MSETFIFGARASCRDGECGMLGRVILEPQTRAATYFVVLPDTSRGTGRLVPTSFVDTVNGMEIRLSCSSDGYGELATAEEPDGIPAAPTAPSDLTMSERLAVAEQTDRATIRWGPLPSAPIATHDRVPDNKIEVCGGDHVHATDGRVGEVQALVIDPSDHEVSFVLLAEGHLWGHKRVAIPITAVSSILDGLRISLSKDEIRDLPEIPTT